MKRKRSIFAVSVIAFLIVSRFLSTNVLCEEITVKGKVNDNYQIIAEDGQIYEAADTDKGNIESFLSPILKKNGKKNFKSQWGFISCSLGLGSSLLLLLTFN